VVIGNTSFVPLVNTAAANPLIWPVVKKGLAPAGWLSVFDAAASNTCSIRAPLVQVTPPVQVLGGDIYIGQRFVIVGAVQAAEPEAVAPVLRGMLYCPQSKRSNEIIIP
jgi:hypothetical protein